MKRLPLNSLKVRYSVITILLAFTMLTFSWFAQEQVSKVESDIQKNIEQRKTLFHRNREIRATLWQFRDELSRFQIDPSNVENPAYLSKLIAQAISSINKLSVHPWIKENYSPIISELIDSLDEFDEIVKKLINTRLTPASIFPSLKIANEVMQPLHSTFTYSLNLAIQELEDSSGEVDSSEYRLLIALRYNWATMISTFRMYLLNRFNAFDESFLVNQLHNIDQLHKVIHKQLSLLHEMNFSNQLTFSTSIALEEFSPAAINWLNQFQRVKRLNISEEWRTDTILYQNELEPRLDKIYTLLREIDIAIEKFNQQDLNKLKNIANFQLKSIWLAAIVGLVVLLIGFVFLVKFILNPISAVTNALKNDSSSTQISVKHDNAIHETKNLITAFAEMRQQIRARQLELEYTALHDSLTGLANRELLNDRLSQSIHNARQERGSFAVMIMDLNRFKEVNDTLGHAVGDKLLQQVAQRLLDTLREVDVVVRLGGDEFAVLLETATEQQAEKIARKILKSFEKVFKVDDVPLYIGISIGISGYPQHGENAQLLQQRADVAMYVAKRNKSGYEVYNAKFDEYSVGKLSLISDLRAAIDENQLYLKYQPVIELKTGQIIGAEALLRWKHPVHGEIFPDEIIPIAEQTGLINPITTWVIEHASDFNKRLKENGQDIKIAINLSVYNLQDNNFINNLVSILEENRVMADSLIMEVTESAMMTNPNKSIKVLNKLSHMGIDIAVDDYGTGYSSLAYLKSLPISRLKIDKSFIIDMIEDENDAMIVRSTVDLAHNLGMKVIAEGIEDKEVMDLLMILGCDQGQGYYINYPVSEDTFEVWLRQYANNANPSLMDMPA